MRLADVRWLPVVPNPGKIASVGLSYEDHRAETGLEATEHPALFLRFAESQVGHHQPLVPPSESPTLDFEAEIAVVIGKPGRRIDRAAARTGAFGPGLVTADEVGPDEVLTLSCSLNRMVVQSTRRP